MILNCPEYTNIRNKLATLRLQDAHDVRAALDDPKKALTITTWILQTGRLEQYSLAKQIEDDNAEETDAIPAPPPQRGRKAEDIHVCRTQEPSNRQADAEGGGSTDCRKHRVHSKGSS